MICTGALVTSIDILQSNDGILKAVGAYFEADITAENQPSTKYHASASLEVILCCGAIATPQVLLLRSAVSLLNDHWLHNYIALVVLAQQPTCGLWVTK